MASINEPQFPTAFILNYIKNDTGKKRFLIYTAFRFFSYAGDHDASLAARLKEKLNLSYTAEDFSAVCDFLLEDDYFSPSFRADSFDLLFLYDAIALVKRGEEGFAILDEVILTKAPVVSGLSYADPSLDLSNLLPTGMDFYAALTIAVLHAPEALPSALSKFAAAYRDEFHFTCEDFILFDFMDEYFEQPNCRRHPAFIELVDALVAATLNYYNTDFGTMVEAELAQCQGGFSSRFAGGKRFGSISLPAIKDNDRACHMLAGLFRYAAVYELRSNLFDFHLEDDKLITLDNWKEKLRWHYVQYSNVYEMAISSFYTAMLSQELLKNQFLKNIEEL